MIHKQHWTAVKIKQRLELIKPPITLRLIFKEAGT